VNTIGIVSGFFNPLHVGHLDYLEKAKEHCDFLVAIINSDYQVKLKGSVPFMPLVHRMRIVSALGCVDMTHASSSEDGTVSKDIEDIFAIFENNDRFRFFNSGDRDIENTPEIGICSKLGIQLMILDQPKVESSSNLLKDVGK